MQVQPFDAYLDAVCSGILGARDRKRARKELLDHLECRTEDAVSEGMPEDDAAAAALESFGSVDEIRAQITRAHRKDNAITVGKGIGQFLLSMLVTAVLICAQALLWILDFGEEAPVFLTAATFSLLTGLSLYAARGRRILLPLMLIPPALCQCSFAYDGEATFLIVLPELLKGNLIGFLQDILYYHVLSSDFSKWMLYAYVLLFAAVNVVISISSFRLKTKRTDSCSLVKTARRGAAVTLAVTLFSSVLCYGVFLIPKEFSFLEYVSEYYIVPAENDAQTQEILRFYSNKNRKKDPMLCPSIGTAFRIRYHHGTNVPAIDADSFGMPEDVFSSESEILEIDSYHIASQDLFYKAYTSRVVIEPKKASGCYVVIPVIDDFVHTERFKTIPWPPEEDVHLYGNMNQNVYEIILKAPTPEGQHE